MPKLRNWKASRSTPKGYRLMFSTWEFWFLVTVTLILYYATRGRLQNAILLIASYIVYAYLDWRFLSLLLLVTLINFGLAKRLVLGESRRRAYLIVGVAFNVGILGLFKYIGDLTNLFNLISIKLGILDAPIIGSLILPLGISFYMFRILSYLFDVYNEQVEATNSLLMFALYVSFFPQIASGPIVRSGPFLDRLKATRRPSQQQLVDGLTFIFMGLFYKIAIGDPLAPTIDKVYQSLDSISSTTALIAIILYSIRIYADFAGYSLLAIGVSVWFSLPFRENFRQPYFSRSITEFWNRWHMSLSSWIRDYMFMPLSRSLLRRWGSRRSFWIQVIAYFSTMIVIGVWHGTGLTFIIWGALHGFYLLSERTISIRIRKIAPLANIGESVLGIGLGILFTWIIVGIAWVFFRAGSVSEALLFFQRLFAVNSPPVAGAPTLNWGALIIPTFLLLLIDLPQAATNDSLYIWRFRLVWRTLLFTVMALSLFILGSTTHEPFIYAGF